MLRLLRPPLSAIFPRSFHLHSPRYARETIAGRWRWETASLRRTLLGQAPESVPRPLVRIEVGNLSQANALDLQNVQSAEHFVSR
jgi:hypothetical protein